MLQISKKFLSSCGNKSIYSNYVLTKVTNIINNIHNNDNSLKVIYNKYNQDIDEHNFIIGDDELKKMYYGQIKIQEYIPENFELVNDKINSNEQINRDDLMFEHIMSIKHALKN